MIQVFCTETESSHERKITEVGYVIYDYPDPR